MYKIKRLTSGDMVMFKNDLQLVILPEKSIVSIEFIIDEKHYQKTYKVLEYFLEEIKNTEDFSILEMTLKTSDSIYPIIYDNIMETGEYVSILDVAYTKEMYVHTQGISDYRYVSDFMPLWSTAFKNAYSNHAQTFEPLFTNALNIDYNVDNLIKEKPIQSLKNILFYKKDPVVESISTLVIDSFIKEKEYVLNSESVVDFGDLYTTIYIKLKNPGDYKIRIKGVYNFAYIKEDIYIKGDALYKLKLKYSQIYSINMLDFFSENTENSVYMSNAYDISSFNYMNKDGRNLEYIDNKIVVSYENSDNKNIFINKLPYYEGIFIDENDNIVAEFDDRLYTAKLNSKLTLDIPKDVSYNNTAYLETIYLSPNEYEICVNVRKFATDFEDARVSISITDSKGKSFYLNSEFSLEESLKEIYVDSNTLKEKIHFNIELDSDVEYVIISIKDNSGIYKKSNLIVQPFLEFVPNLYILPTQELLMLNDKFYLLDTSEFKLTPLLLNETQTSLKDSVNYHYYYMTSEIYPLTPEPDPVYTTLSGFDISIISTKTSRSLSNETFSGGTGAYMSQANNKVVIVYTTHNIGKDLTYATGISNFSLTNKPVISYKTYFTDPDTFSNTGIKQFTTVLKKYPIINEDLNNKINVTLSNFEIILEE